MTHLTIPQRPRRASTNRPKVSLGAARTRNRCSMGHIYLAQQRAADLERRERDLETRERALGERAEHIRKHGRNNFPPFFPLIYHSIPDEIPEPSRPLINRLFQLWLVLAAALIINLVACIVLVVSGQGDGVRDLSGAITYVEVAARFKSAGPLTESQIFPYHWYTVVLAMV
jgi:SCAMP family